MPPSPLPDVCSRPRRTRRLQRVLLLSALVASLVVISQDSPGRARAAEAPLPGDVLRGVIERLAVDTTSTAGTPTSSPPVPTTWLRTATDHIPLDADAVRSVPTGSTVAVRLEPGGEQVRERTVSWLSVLSRATSTPPTSRTTATAVHAVTVVLALPARAKTDGMTAAALSRTVSGGVATFWSRTSDGRFTFSVAKKAGWIRLTSSCTDPWAVWDEVRRRVGFTPGPRRHLLVYAPNGAGCPTGLATIGSNVDAGGSTIVGGSTPALLAHELGHNLGLGHSDALACTGASDGTFTGNGFGSACHRVPYGDWYDVMGISWENLGSLSTAHAFRLGLLPASAVVTTRAPVRVTLRPVSGRAGVRSLRILDPAGAVYVVEYRPAKGTDAWLATSADWRGLEPGVLVRRIDPGDPTQTLLLDATPSTDPTDTNVVMSARRTLATASGRVDIMVESVSEGAATVAVTVDDVRPALVIEPRGPLADGHQVTIGQALATWGKLAS